MTTMAAARHRERLAYIADLLQQLERMAEVEKEYFVAYLVGLAKVEAKCRIDANSPSICPVVYPCPEAGVA